MLFMGCNLPEKLCLNSITSRGIQSKLIHLGETVNQSDLQS